jgi:hypothetical protein
VRAHDLHVNGSLKFGPTHACTWLSFAVYFDMITCLIDV